MTIISVVVLMVATSLSRLRTDVYPNLDHWHQLRFKTLRRNSPAKRVYNILLVLARASLALAADSFHNLGLASPW